MAAVIACLNGSLYGTTYAGGDLNCTLAFGGCGVVFQLTPSGGQWTYSTIHEFNGVTDGCCQFSTLSQDPAGRPSGVLYETLSGGSTDGGMVVSVP